MRKMATESDTMSKCTLWTAWDQGHTGRFRSISVANLIKLVNLLAGLEFFAGTRREQISSEHLRRYLCAGKHHPAQLWPGCFSKEEPVAAITYEWKLSFSQLLTYLNQMQIEKCLNWNSKIPSDMSKLLIWIDILFIHQLSDISVNLVAAEKVYRNTNFHLALVTSSMCSRAWCLYEMAVRFNEENSSGTVPVQSSNPALSGLMASSGNFFEDMVATKEDDMKSIKRTILEVFGSPAKFNKTLQPFFVSVGGRIK